jgi:hypothetical protein
MVIPALATAGEFSAFHLGSSHIVDRPRHPVPLRAPDHKPVDVPVQVHNGESGITPAEVEKQVQCTAVASPSQNNTTQEAAPEHAKPGR